MKKLINVSLFIFIVIFLYTCGNDSVNNNNNPPSTSSFTISGSAENWIYGGNILLKAEVSDTNYLIPNYVLDSCFINNNGVFSLKLKNAPDNFLYSINFGPDSNCISNVIINPANTRASNMLNLNLQDDSLGGYIIRSNYAMDSIIYPGQFFVYYIYLNQSVSITGVSTCSYGSFNDSAVFNFTGVRGWNKMVVIYEYYSYNSAKYNITNTEPPGGKWFANVFRYSLISDKSSLAHRIFKFNKFCIPCN